jgi:hypothetical protein
MTDNIEELGAHEPSVESVISRLDRYQGKIKSITAIVTWEDDTSDVYSDTKPITDLSFECFLLQSYILDSINGD